jgi:hypothetical protein
MYPVVYFREYPLTRLERTLAITDTPPTPPQKLVRFNEGLLCCLLAYHAL